MTSTILICCRIHSVIFLSLRHIPSILRFIALWVTRSLFAVCQRSMSELEGFTNRNAIYNDNYPHFTHSNRNCRMVSELLFVDYTVKLSTRVILKQMFHWYHHHSRMYLNLQNSIEPSARHSICVLYENDLVSSMISAVIKILPLSSLDHRWVSCSWKSGCRSRKLSTFLRSSTPVVAYFRLIHIRFLHLSLIGGGFNQSFLSGTSVRLWCSLYFNHILCTAFYLLRLGGSMFVTTFSRVVLSLLPPLRFSLIHASLIASFHTITIVY